MLPRVEGRKQVGRLACGPIGEWLRGGLPNAERSRIQAACIDVGMPDGQPRASNLGAAHVTTLPDGTSGRLCCATLVLSPPAAPHRRRQNGAAPRRHAPPLVHERACLSRHTAAASRPLRPQASGAHERQRPAAASYSSTAACSCWSLALPPAAYSRPPSAAAPQLERACCWLGARKRAGQAHSAAGA